MTIIYLINHSTSKLFTLYFLTYMAVFDTLSASGGFIIHRLNSISGQHPGRLIQQNQPAGSFIHAQDLNDLVILRENFSFIETAVILDRSDFEGRV